jgi:hypothetical protein
VSVLTRQATFATRPRRGVMAALEPSPLRVLDFVEGMVVGVVATVWFLAFALSYPG